MAASTGGWRWSCRDSGSSASRPSSSRSPRWGLAALAGLGWDGLRAGRAGRFAVLFASSWSRASSCSPGSGSRDRPSSSRLSSARRPLDVRPARCRRGLPGARRAAWPRPRSSRAWGWWRSGSAATRPLWAGVVALMVMTADLAVANARYVVTVPQAVLESKPEVLRVIEDHEREHPRDGTLPHPSHAGLAPVGSGRRLPSADRARDFVAWERDTLQPKYGITLGVEYTHTFGVGRLYDYDWFFDDFPRGHPHAGGGRSARRPDWGRRSSTSPPILRHVEHPLLHHPLLSARMAGRVSRVCLVLVPDRADLSPAPAPRGPDGPRRSKDGWRIRLADPAQPGRVPPGLGGP